MPTRPSPRDMGEVARTLGEKVRMRRVLLQLTQEELADLSGVSRNQIQNIEHSRNNTKDPQTRRPGNGNPRLDTVFALADALRIEIADLIDPGRPLPESE